MAARDCNCCLWLVQGVIYVPPLTEGPLKGNKRRKGVLRIDLIDLTLGDRRVRSLTSPLRENFEHPAPRRGETASMPSLSAGRPANKKEVGKRGVRPATHRWSIYYTSFSLFNICFIHFQYWTVLLAKVSRNVMRQWLFSQVHAMPEYQ